MNTLRNKIIQGAATVCLGLACTGVVSAAEKTYHVTLTNITKGIAFTPFIAATHTKGIQFYSVGEAASGEIAAIAEGGDIVPLMDALLASNSVFDIQSTTDLLSAGSTVSFDIAATPGARFLSMAAMLLPTNDTFIGADALPLPKRGKQTIYLYAYDAGSEPNDEMCMNIPGPTCAGEGLSELVDGEGYIYPSPGIHGEGDLSKSMYDWQGAVAKVTIEVTQAE